jgi:hypothetical protein
MILKKWMSENNVYPAPLAEALGVSVPRVYRLLDRHVFSQSELKGLIDDCITRMNGEYRLVKSKVNADGSIELKISLFPADKLPGCGVKKTALQWIEELSSTNTSGQVALKSGFKLGTIHSIASRAGIKFKKGR